VFVAMRRRRSEALAVAGLVGLAAFVFVMSSAWTARVDQLGNEAFYASTVDVPAQFTIDGSGELIDVTITNDSVRSWSAQGDEQVLISARWFGPDGMIWTEDRWRLPHDLSPGQTVRTGLTLDARLPLGIYEVRWDLLIVNTAYFGQFLGDEPIVNTVDIVESDVLPNHFYRYELVERSTGIGRIDGWKLAWQDFRSSPLLGVGPNQFADQAESELESELQSVGAHAHSLLFEPLAAWGLLGTSPFVTLGAWAMLRAFRVAWLTQSLVPSVVASGLTAVLVHGTVDWPLVTVTTSIPVGLLVGLALSDAMDPSSEGPHLSYPENVATDAN